MTCTQCSTTTSDTTFTYNDKLLCKHCYQKVTDKLERYDAVNHPKHYTSHPSGVECIEITRHMTFNLGNVIKYLWRADHKNASLEDLKKAAWYLNDEIQRLETTHE